jgi:hypothetical protein
LAERHRAIEIAATAALLLSGALVVVVLTGCLPAVAPSTSRSAATTTPKVPGVSALGAYAPAFASARMSAPDARFLLVQTSQIATMSPPATWSYLFASKSNKKIYLVAVTDGRAAGATSMGTSTLKPADYDKIPAPAAWKIDSSAAFDSAAAAYTERFGTAAPVDYAMGLATFVPNVSSGIKPFVWSVKFAPAGQGAQPREILVDATTGVVVPAKK